MYLHDSTRSNCPCIMCGSVRLYKKQQNTKRAKQQRIRVVGQCRSSAHRAALVDSPGTFTADEWLRLCNDADNKCLACGKKTKLTVDHVIPLALGGSNSIDNIQPLCRPCNSAKFTDDTDYRSV